MWQDQGIDSWSIHRMELMDSHRLSLIKLKSSSPVQHNVHWLWLFTWHHKNNFSDFRVKMRVFSLLSMQSRGPYLGSLWRCLLALKVPDQRIVNVPTLTTKLPFAWWPWQHCRKCRLNPFLVCEIRLHSCGAGDQQGPHVGCGTLVLFGIANVELRYLIIIKNFMFF